MGDNIIKFVPIIISLLTVLSYFLAINEYYVKKAYWDFFHINECCRESMRSGFHAEYLSYALLILIMLAFIDYMLVYFWRIVRNPQKNFLLLCAIIFVLVLIAAYIVIWKFNLTDVNERRIWESKRTYHQFIRKKYRFFIEKYGVPYWIVIFSLYYLSIKQKYIISVLLFTIAFVIIQFQNYSQQQQAIIDIKWFDIVSTEEGFYVVLGQNGELMQLNRCNIEKNTLFINLDEVMLRKINSITYKTICTKF